MKSHKICSLQIVNSHSSMLDLKMKRFTRAREESSKDTAKSFHIHQGYKDDNPPHFLEVPASRRDEFCEVCRDVDIERIFIQEEPYVWDDPRYLPPARSLRHIKEHQQCPLCRLTLSSFNGSELLNQTDREETPIEAVVVGVGRSNYHGPIAKKLKNKLRTFDDDISQPLCRL
jgi:hypothetical protein